MSEFHDSPSETPSIPLFDPLTMQRVDPVVTQPSFQQLPSNPPYSAEPTVNADSFAEASYGTKGETQASLPLKSQTYESNLNSYESYPFTSSLNTTVSNPYLNTYHIPSNTVSSTDYPSLGGMPVANIPYSQSSDSLLFQDPPFNRSPYQNENHQSTHSLVETGRNSMLLSPDMHPHDRASFDFSAELDPLCPLRICYETPTEIPSSSLEPEEHCIAWIWPPSVSSAIETALSNHCPLSRDQLTTPGVFELQNKLADPVGESWNKLRGNSTERFLLTAENVKKDEDGLRTLIVNECLRGAVELTQQMLSDYSQGPGMAGIVSAHNPHSLSIWHTRLALLVKLRLYPEAEKEFEYFGNMERADLSYEYYPHLYPSKKGSMIPFSMRVLWAELPALSGKHNETLDRIAYLLSTTRKILSKYEEGKTANGETITSPESNAQALELWKKRELRLMYGFANTFLAIKNYSLTLDILHKIRLKESKQNFPFVTTAIGRVYLQLGNIKMAQERFNEIAELPESKTVKSVICQHKMNTGIYCMALNKFKDAKNAFKEVTEMNPNDVVAWNNLAVVNMYLGCLREATASLEKVTNSTSKRCLSEALLVNLATLYGSETPKSLGKKLLLLEKVAKVKGDAFNTECLQLA